MFSFFESSDPDSEERASRSGESQDDSSELDEVATKSMADYYNDIEAIIEQIRDDIKHADKDVAFRHAAAVLTRVVELCRDIEYSLNPVTAWKVNTERSRLLKTIGTDGLIDVKGDASRELAVQYRRMMIAVANKEYWPDPPMLFASLVHTRYASELEKRAEETERRIQVYQERIDAYDKSRFDENAKPVTRRSP